MPLLSPQSSILSILEKYKWIKGTINNTTVYYPLDLKNVKIVKLTEDDNMILKQ
jgi:hypothetical protein